MSVGRPARAAAIKRLHLDLLPPCPLLKTSFKKRRSMAAAERRRDRERACWRRCKAG